MGMRSRVRAAIFVAAFMVATASHADTTCLRPDDAAVRYRQIAFGAADAASGLEATRLYLEALDALGRTGARRDCWDDMARDVLPLRERWCQASGNADSDACVLVSTIHYDLQRLRAESFVVEADKKEGRAASALYEKGAQLHFETFRDACHEPSSRRRAPRVRRAESCEELAYNAARAYAAAHDRTRAISPGCYWTAKVDATNTNTEISGDNNATAGACIVN